MNDTVGRSVRLFLVEGNPLGLITAEIVNWSGHVLAGPRTGLAKLLARPEVDRTGIYFLYGHEPKDPDTAIVYIGESDNVGKRLKQHSKDEEKAFWERTCVVTSKDQNITKSHARYLESRLIIIAQDAGRAALKNTAAPLPITLPEADQSDMEYFIAQIRLVLPVLGFEYLRSKPNPSVAPSINEPLAQSPIFELASKKLGLKAQAREIDNEFVVLAGSQTVSAWKQKTTTASGYAKLHQKLINQGKLVATATDGLATFVEHTPFSSPSAASAVIFGRTDNGRTSWRIQGKDITYATWQEQQVENIAPTSTSASQNE